jgi:hypothetical protein
MCEYMCFVLFLNPKPQSLNCSWIWNWDLNSETSSKALISSPPCPRPCATLPLPKTILKKPSCSFQLSEGGGQGLLLFASANGWLRLRRLWRARRASCVRCPCVCCCGLTVLGEGWQVDSRSAWPQEHETLHPQHLKPKITNTTLNPKSPAKHPKPDSPRPRNPKP